MFSDNLKLAIHSLRSTKWRSFLTMLGIIVGVFSVVTTVSIGIGIRQQITGQIKDLGSDLITVLPGQTSDSALGLLSRINVLPSQSTGALTQKDLTLIAATKGVKVAVPLTSISGPVVINGHTYSNQQVIATTQGFPTVVNQGLAYGQFFGNDDTNEYEAVIGQNIALDLFKEYFPIGQSMKINGQTFQVVGVLNQFNNSLLTPVSNYNNAIFIPQSVGSQMSGGQPQIYEIFAKPYTVDQTLTTASAINTTLLNEHGGQGNFTILKQQQALEIADKTLNVLTALIAAVAAISLFVGGIGIMNIMFAAVVERTKEIGIRKAIGATNRQILQQFVMEAGIIGLTGGIVAVILSMIADLIISYFSDIRPAISWQLYLIAIAGGLLAGVVFGLMPAWRASHRDPIDSLRHE